MPAHGVQRRVTDMTYRRVRDRRIYYNTILRLNGPTMMTTNPKPLFRTVTFITSEQQ